MSSNNKQSSFTSTAEGRKEPSSVSSSEVRLVLLGKTTTGKSSTANSILGRRAFKSKCSSFSINQQCLRACGDSHGRHITLMDTPASVDRQQTSKEVQRELRRCVTLLFPGVHAFLLVLQIGRFTQEEREAVRLIQQALGPRALEFSVVVFTHGDGLDEGMSMRDCPMQWSEGLAELVAKCGGRYCIFSNHTSKTKDQVAVLLNLVDSISEANRGSLYTCKTLRELCDEPEEKVAQVPQQEMRLQPVNVELQKGERKEAMREWYQRELEKAQQKSTRQMEDLQRNQQKEREMERKLSRGREDAAGRERMEDNDKIEKERQIQDMAIVTEIREEEETKREALRVRLEEVIKTLKEQRDTEGSMRREVENIIQRDRAEHEKNERQWQLQQLEREQTIRQGEEVKREALQNELNRLTQVMEEQSRREEQSARQREELIRNEREKSKREKERDLENQKEERKKRETLQQQLRLVTVKAEALQQQLRMVTLKVEEQKAKEAKLRRDLNESLQRERERCEICTLREECNVVGRSELFDEVILKWPAAEHTSAAAFVRPVSGYPREMGLLVLNAALETIGAPCCIQ